MESTKNTDGRPALRPHQEQLIKIAVDGYKAGRDNAKFMGISVPTAAGKTFILPYLFDELRKLDPEVKFIIATSQNGLIQDIIQHFLAHGKQSILHIKGTENQVRSIADDVNKLEQAKNACCVYIRKASGGISFDNTDKNQENNPITEFIRKLDNAMVKVQSINALEQTQNLSSLMKIREELLEKQRAELCSNYIKAERILEKALRAIASRNAELVAEIRRKAKLEKVKKKQLQKNCYIELLQTLPDVVRWLFPDLLYELADIVVLTHAKVNHSILTKRQMKLSDISYDKEGCHIVYISDEAENWREDYVNRVVGQAVKNETDLLPFLNLIYNVLQSGYFDNDDYLRIDKFGNLTNSAAERAQELRNKFDAFMDKYAYVSNMHMADISTRDKMPQITNCPGYIISGNSALRFIKTDKSSQSISLVTNNTPDKEPLQNESDSQTLISFVTEAHSLIRQYVGVVRTAAWTLNALRDARGHYEDISDTVASVVYRTFGDKNSSAARYIIDSTYPRYGAKYEPGQDKNQYRYDVSHTCGKAGTPYGGDVSLRHSSTGRFPEAVLEDAITNVRFTYLISGTGWLPALGNNNMAYLDEKCGQYHPAEEEIIAIHDAYMMWKGEQYKKAGTQFIVERLTGTGQKKKYYEKDNEIVCSFIGNHIRHTKEHGVKGGTGAFIFTPRKLDEYIKDIFSTLREMGADIGQIQLLTLKKGMMHAFDYDGNIRDLSDCECKIIDDTFIIDTSDNRYYYVITAHRSGTRGYNIAFRNEQGIYDASGVCLFELTNIIPQKPENKKKDQKDITELQAYADGIKEDTKRILLTNMACIHCILMRDGQITSEALSRIYELIKEISYDSHPIGKDLYPEDPWSPYKLQGVAECLQALGRIRNNEKPPVMYIALSNGLFQKQFFLEEQLQPMYLSYEAMQVYDHLPVLWQAYEEENASHTSEIMPDEANLTQSWNHTIKKLIPKVKKKAAKDAASMNDLKELVMLFEEAKQRAISLNVDVLDRFRKDKDALFLANRGINAYSDHITAFSYLSRYDSREGMTFYELTKKDGVLYMTPNSLLLTETAELFSMFCGESMKREMPAVMNPNIMNKMKESDRFPYAPSKFGYDVLSGEYGERLFKAVMKEALNRGMTELTVMDMPLPQYEDYDFMMCMDGNPAGYVNVKYRKVSEFPLEKDLRLYAEKLSRSPLTGIIRILYINMRPAGDRSAVIYTEDNSKAIQKVNSELSKSGKKVELFALSPFTLQDLCDEPEMFIEKISTYMIYQVNSFFIR